MARIRYIKPEFSFDEELSKLSAEDRLFYILSWTHMDREGRCEDRPEKLRALIFPYEQRDVNAILDRLHPHFIRRYEANGKKYLAVNQEAWKRHQKPHIKEAPSAIPEPNRHLTSTGSSSASTLPAALLMGMGNGDGDWENNRKTDSPSAVDFSQIRFPYGKDKGVYVSELPLDSVKLYLRDARLGAKVRAALEARLDQHKADCAR